jgi:hypothetical protein
MAAMSATPSLVKRFQIRLLHEGLRRTEPVVRAAQWISTKGAHPPCAVQRLLLPDSVAPLAGGTMSEAQGSCTASPIPLPAPAGQEP